MPSDIDKAFAKWYEEDADRLNALGDMAHKAGAGVDMNLDPPEELNDDGSLADADAHRTPTENVLTNFSQNYTTEQMDRASELIERYKEDGRLSPEDGQALRGALQALTANQRETLWEAHGLNDDTDFDDDEDYDEGEDL